MLVQHVTGRNRAWLLAHDADELGEEEAQRIFRLARQRASHVPLQYLTGQQEFYGLGLQVNPAVLIPRPETELLVEAVVRRSSSTGISELRIVDVGTGSGAIAVALASELPGAEVWAVDVSTEALQVARNNADRLDLGKRVHLRESDLLTALVGQFDVVVSNPPYVPVGDASGMQPEVRDHEPHLALFAGVDGLEVYRRLIPQAWAALRPGGLLAMEFGFGQRDAIAGLLHSWSGVQFQDDYAGIPRIVLAEKSREAI